MIHDSCEVKSRIPESVKVWHRSQIMEKVTIGEDTSIGRDVFIGGGTFIGSGCKIQNSCQIFGANIGNNVLLGPRCVLVEDPTPRVKDKCSEQRKKENANYSDFEKKPVTILEGASIGAGSVLAPGVTIGKYAMVSVGSVVISNVPDYALCLGNPAKNISQVCECGKKVNQCLKDK